MLYFPSEGRRAEDFFRPKNPQTWVLKASTLPLDHRSRYVWEKLLETIYSTFLLWCCLPLVHVVF